MKLLLQGAGASAAVGLARSQARCLQRACAPAAPRPACSPCQAQGQALHTAQAAATESQQAAAPRPEGEQRPSVPTGIAQHVLDAAAERSGQHGCNTGAGPGPRPSDGWRIAMLFDGDCPLCMREVNMLRRRDAQQGRIKFVDIASPDYSPSENAGISYEQVLPCPALRAMALLARLLWWPTRALCRRWATYTPSRARVRCSPTSRCVPASSQLQRLCTRVWLTPCMAAGVQAPLRAGTLRACSCPRPTGVLGAER